MGLFALPFRHLALVAPKSVFTISDLKKKGYPTSPQTPGERLKRWRMDNGLTQRKVAALLGIDHSTLHNWEINRRQIRQAWQPMVFKLMEGQAHLSQERG